MSKYGSPSFSLLLVDGRSLLGAKPKGFSDEHEALQERTDGLGDVWEEYTPTGMKKAMLAQDGAFFDDETNGMHQSLHVSQGTSRILCYGVEGNVLGKHFVGFQGTYAMKYAVLGQLGNLTKANVTYQVSGEKNEGLILQELEAKTADWTTESAESVDSAADPFLRVIPITSNSIANPSVVTTAVPHGLTTGDIILISGVATSDPTINGSRTVTVISDTTFSVPVNVTTGGTGGSFVRANSSAGGVGYLQVTAASGFTNFVGTIRDSADDITFADLIVFADNVSAPFAERVAVSGVVDRYLGFDGDVTTTGSITVFCGFSRS